MNILQKLLEYVKLFEQGKISQEELIKVQKQYINKMKILENKYETANSIEKKKIYNKIKRLTDKHLLIFD